MAAFSLRHFEGCDLEQVVGIWNQTLRRDPTDVGRFSRWLLGDDNYRPGPDSGFVVAVKGGQVGGFARAIVRYRPNDRPGPEPEDGWTRRLDRLWKEQLGNRNFEIRKSAIGVRLCRSGKLRNSNLSLKQEPGSLY